MTSARYRCVGNGFAPHHYDRSTHICFRRSFDDVTRINFRFRLLVISAWPRCIFPYNFLQDIFIQSKVIDIFPKLKMAAAAILDFQFMWIWPFRRVDSVVFELCTKFGSNICCSHWDRHTYASDFHLMTPRELTFGFDFWWRCHLRMAVMHFHIKFGANIFIKSGVIDIFPKFKMAPAAILDFYIMWIWPFGRVDSVVFVLCTKLC